MPDPIKSESPLARFTAAARAAPSAEGAGVVARELALAGHLNVRGDPRDARLMAAVGEVLGAGLPKVANTVREAPGNTAYWLGPDEWLIVTAGERRAAIEGGLRAARAASRFAVTDLSGGQTIVLLRGRPVRELLAKGCPLDLHPRTFGPGRCAQSHLAKAPILIRQVDQLPSFEIVVRRSFADYFWTWLEDAASEYGLAVAG